LPADLATAPARLPDSLAVQRSSRTVIWRQTARTAVRSGALWGYIFGVIVASSAVSYTTIYKTQAERDHLAGVFGPNKATAALFGPAPQLQTVAGFTVFKSFMTLMVLGAIWGLLTSTRLLRGEEDAGRWELLLAGQTTPRKATALALGGLAAGIATLWAMAALISVLAGQYSKVGIAPGPMLYFSVAQVATAVMFVAVGALASQLAGNRRRAASYAGWCLGLFYAVRMVADAGVGLHGLIWISPLGWVEKLQPLTSPQPLALLPIAAFSAVVAFLAVHFAALRDIGAGTLRDRDRAPARLRLLRGPLGLTARLVRPSAVAWALALAATGLVLGVIARAGGGTISGSSVETVFSRLGAPGTGPATFLGVSFLIVAVLVAFVAAGQVAATRAEEANGRLDQLLVRPVSRASWLAGRGLLATVVVLVCCLVAGVTAWVGTTVEGSGVNLGTLVNAALNVAAPALCLWGIGTLAFGLWPRATSYAVYGVLGWAVLVELVGGAGATNRWALDSSIFHQMAAAPAVAPNWTANAIMVIIGAVCAAAGAWAFNSRDIQGA
jgi:ABC-2 type transport system permease protein